MLCGFFYTWPLATGVDLPCLVEVRDTLGMLRNPGETLLNEDLVCRELPTLKHICTVPFFFGQFWVCTSKTVVVGYGSYFRDAAIELEPIGPLGKTWFEIPVLLCRL